MQIFLLQNYNKRCAFTVQKGPSIVFTLSKLVIAFAIGFS